jgi:hypothetical protein
MEHRDRFLVIPRTIARTPGSLGLNAEVLMHEDATNLWDWVADSGAQSLRVMHPEIRPRREVLPAAAWPVADRAGFAAWRAQVLADPHGPHRRGGLRLGDEVPWLGCADRFLPRIRAAGAEAVASCGWAPHDCDQPILAEGGDPLDDAAIGWGAAASCYDAWFGYAFHLAGRHGLRRFLCCNEPENRFGWYNAPTAVAALPKEGRWMRLFRHSDDEAGSAWLDAVARQTGAVARFARLAIDDAARLLGAQLSFYGPTTVCWHGMWERGTRFYDALDWHHYHPEPRTFRAKWPAVAAAAAAAGKGVAMTEFNRMAGGTPVGATLFEIGNSLQAMDLLLAVMSLSRPGDPTLELACLYLLHHPSTHRNHKHLLYGSMDMADWSGRDKPLWDRGSSFEAGEWLPSADELTIRHATPAYALFRMAARAAGAFGGRPGPHPVLDLGQDNPTSSGPEDIHPGLTALAVDQGDRLVVTVLNLTQRAAPRAVLDLSLLGGRFATVIERRTTGDQHDRVVAWHDAGRVEFAVPAQSCVQLIAVPWRRAAVRPVRLESAGLCGDRLDRPLAPWRTLRLRAIAAVDGVETDLSDLAVRWSSAHPDLVAAHGGGLVQRRRPSAVATPVRAELPDGSAWPGLELA